MTGWQALQILMLVIPSTALIHILADERERNREAGLLMTEIPEGMITRDENMRLYKEEMARTILQEDRHRSLEPYEWFGPSEEPCPPGPNCKCSGCDTRFRIYKE